MPDMAKVLMIYRWNRMYRPRGIIMVMTETAIAMVNSVPPSALIYICRARDRV